MRSLPIALIAVVVAISGCTNESQYLNKDGDINQKLCDSYFSMVDAYMLHDADMQTDLRLPASLETVLKKALLGWNSKDYFTNLTPNVYIANIAEKNYYLAQVEPSHGLYEIAIPKDYQTESGKKLWKCGIHVVFKTDGNGNVHYKVFHESSLCRFTFVNNNLQYISVDSSFGMNYTLIRFHLFRVDDLAPIVQETVFSSGSLVPNILLHWTSSKSKILFEGVSDANANAKLLTFKKEYKL